MLKAIKGKGNSGQVKGLIFFLEAEKEEDKERDKDDDKDDYEKRAK